MSAAKATAAFSILTFFMVLAHLLRSTVTWIRKLYLPSSLLAGLIGFATINLIKLSASAKDFLEEEVTLGWAELPSVLTNVVFTTLILGERVPSLREVRLVSGPQLCFGQIQALGQYLISGLLTGLWFIPVYNVAPEFAAVTPIGLEGGHGVAAGMKDSFVRHERTSEYYDLTLISATLGLFVGTLIGWGTVNYGLRFDKFSSHASTKSRSVDGRTKIDWWSFNAVYPRNKRPPLGQQTVASESLDSLSLHIGMIGVASAIGWVIKQGLVQIEHTSSWLDENEFFSSFPMFPFSLVGALIVQSILDRLGDRFVIQLDRVTMEHISGLCMDYLVMSAIIELNISIRGELLTPFFISFTACCLWSIIAMCTIGRLLPDMWLERALVETGLALGATATALLMLRMVDPDNKTLLLKSFCFKQMFHVLIVGGGVYTSTSILQLQTIGTFGLAGTAAAGLLMWLAVLIYFRNKGPQEVQEIPAGGDVEKQPLLGSYPLVG